VSSEFQLRTVSAPDGTDLAFYWRDGDENLIPLMLIPGLGMPAQTWFAVIATMDWARPIVVVDPRGSGRSGDASDPCDFAADTITVLAALGWDRAHVAGISMGGMIAQQMVIEFPSSVASLSLVSTYARAGPWASTVWRLRLLLLELADPVPQRLLAALVLTGPAAVEANAGIVDELFGLWEASTSSPTSYLRQMSYCEGHDMIEELRGVKTPSVVIGGAEDLLCTPGASDELAGVLECEYVSIRSATHLLANEYPEVLSSLIDGHVSDVDAK